MKPSALNTRITMPRRTRRKTFSTNNMEITKKEILFSVIIFLVLLAIGISISGKISDSAAEHAEVYIKAIPIESKEHFERGLETSIGNALVYGEFSAVDTVSFPEISNSYYAIRKETERYTMHTRTVTTTVNGKTQTRTETYYTWDNQRTDTQTAQEFSLHGNVYPSTKINVSAWRSLRLDIDTVNQQYLSSVSGGYIYQDSTFWHTVGDLRYSYDYIPATFSGTMLTKLHGNDFINAENPAQKINVNHEKTISATVDEAKNAGKVWLILFWVVWIILIGGAIWGFIYLDNRWINS